MEQRTHEESEQTVLDFKNQNNLPGVEKSGALSSASLQRPEIVGSQHLQAKVLSLTPEKANEPLRIKRNTEASEFPEKYRTISELFDRMTSSLRLLRLCKKSPTFQNICSQVEVLAGREFTYRHLAQLKFILPEAVQIDKILIHDQKTMCMKPEMKITLLCDIVEGHREQSTYTALRVVFASRLLNFFSTHPEGCDIPEAVLPEPFNQRSITTTTDSLLVDSSTESVPNSIEAELLNSSHLHPSFNRHFSQKGVIAETEKTQLLASSVPLSSIKYGCMTYQDTENGQQRTSPNSCSETAVITNPVQQTYPPCFSSSACERTPTKFALEADNLMVETPAQLTPRRSVPSCDDKLKTMTGENVTACTLAAKRSLDFSYLEGEENFFDSTADEKDQYKVVSNIIPQTEETKGIFVEDSVCCSAAPVLKSSQVEETSYCTTKDHMTNQSGLISHKEISASLSDLVALINRIFKSANCSSITKDELVFKILMNTCDIVDRREVEEQMERLEKVVPDWIYRKLAPSGDLLYNIKKVSDLNSVCDRLIDM